MSKRRKFPESKRRFRRAESKERLPGVEDGRSVHRFLATVLELASDGEIRAGKKSYGDTAVGFWIGVDPADALAKLHVGDEQSWWRWNGSRVEQRGNLELEPILGKFDGGRIVWIEADGTEWLSIGSQVDFGAITGLIIEAKDSLTIGVEGDLGLMPTGVLFVNNKRITGVADAMVADDALNRQSGDGRYLQQSAGWSGSFTNGDGDTVTVVDGQITGVA